MVPLHKNKPKHLGPDIGARFRPDINSTIPNIAPDTDSTTYIYIYMYIHTLSLSLSLSLSPFLLLSLSPSTKRPRTWEFSSISIATPNPCFPPVRHTKKSGTTKKDPFCAHFFLGHFYIFSPVFLFGKKGATLRGHCHIYMYIYIYVYVYVYIGTH